MSAPSWSFQRNFTVAPSSVRSSRTEVSSGGRSAVTSSSRRSFGRSVIAAGSSVQCVK